MVSQVLCMIQMLIVHMILNWEMEIMRWYDEGGEVPASPYDMPRPMPAIKLGLERVRRYPATPPPATEQGLN